MRQATLLVVEGDELSKRVLELFQSVQHHFKANVIEITIQEAKPQNRPLPILFVDAEVYDKASILQYLTRLGEARNGSAPGNGQYQPQ